MAHQQKPTVLAGEATLKQSCTCGDARCRKAGLTPAHRVAKGVRCAPGTEFVVNADRTMEPKS